MREHGDCNADDGMHKERDIICALDANMHCLFPLMDAKPTTIDVE